MDPANLQSYPNRFVRTEVTDDGPGIEPEAIGHIFECYYRSDKRKSTGPGLAISKNVADIHHESIEVDSAMGAGTVFTIILPLLASEK